MALFGSAGTVRLQAPQSAVFSTAWAYIEDLLRPGSPVHQRIGGLGAGTSEKHELPNGVFAIEQVYETKPRADGFFESHRKYVDIQVIVAGEETMEVSDIGRAIVKDAYQDSRDLITYTDIVEASLLRVRAGEVAIFFPTDVHMPSLRIGPFPTLVRKSVLKLPVAV